MKTRRPHVIPIVSPSFSLEAELARLRHWMGWAVFAGGTLFWLADLAQWLAPA